MQRCERELKIKRRIIGLQWDPLTMKRSYPIRRQLGVEMEKAQVRMQPREMQEAPAAGALIQVPQLSQGNKELIVVRRAVVIEEETSLEE